MTSKIRAFYTEKNILTDVELNPERRITSSLAAINLFKKELWSIGDCQFMLDNELFSTKKKVDEVAEEAIDDLKRYDIGREFILPLLERQSRFQNNPNAGEFYYAAVDGFRIPDDGIMVKAIPDEVTHYTPHRSEPPPSKFIVTWFIAEAYSLPTHQFVNRNASQKVLS